MDQPTQSTFWIGLTFDYPAYEAPPAYPGLSYPAGRGLCVGLDGSMAILRRPDGGHTLVPTAETRHVAEIPRVEPGEPRYQSHVTFVHIARARDYDAPAGWEITGVTSVDASQVAFTMRRRVTS